MSADLIPMLRTFSAIAGLPRANVAMITSNVTTRSLVLFICFPPFYLAVNDSLPGFNLTNQFHSSRSIPAPIPVAML